MPLQFLTGDGHGLAGFFPAFLRASQTDLDSQDLCQKPFHYAPGQTADYGEIGDQCRQMGSKMSGDLFGQWRPGYLSALTTHHVRELIFGDVRLDGRYFGDLMPARLPLRGHLVRILRQLFPAVPALTRQQHL